MLVQTCRGVRTQYSILKTQDDRTTVLKTDHHRYRASNRPAVSCQDRPRYRPGYRAGYQYCMVYCGTLYNNGDLEKTSSA